METDKDPTFAEALLALVIAEQKFKRGESIVDAWRIASERAASFVRGCSLDGYLTSFASPAIRRALVVDAPGGNSDRVRGCEDTLNRHAQWITENEVAISELKKAALGVDKMPDTEFDGLPMGRLISMLSDAKAGRPISKADADAMGGWLTSRALGVDKPPAETARTATEAAMQGERRFVGVAELARANDDIMRLRTDLAAAVARAEKAEADVQSAFGRGVKLNDATMAAKLATAEKRAEKAEAQAAEARDAFTLAVGERDALRAELDKAKAECDERHAKAVSLADKLQAARCELSSLKQPPECEVERPWWRATGRAPLNQNEKYIVAIERKVKAMEAELENLRAIAGKALGTDPEFYNDGCVLALADHAENLRRTNGEQRAELQRIGQERDALAARLAAARKALDAKEQP